MRVVVTYSLGQRDVGTITNHNSDKKRKSVTLLTHHFRVTLKIHIKGLPIITIYRKYINSRHMGEVTLQESTENCTGLTSQTKNDYKTPKYMRSIITEQSVHQRL